MYPDINMVHASFVLNYAKETGLKKIVSRLEVNKENNSLEFDIQPLLIEAFNLEFINVSNDDLHNTIEWVIIKSFEVYKKRKIETNDSK